LKSTPLRLERALAAMDAGFAQDSHKLEHPTDAVMPASTPTTTDKRLIQ
jgi:hypothetical protein